MTEQPLGTTTESKWRRVGIREGVYRVTPETPVALLSAIEGVIGTPATLLRKEAFVRAGGFYYKTRCVFAEDTHLWIKLLLRHAFAYHAQPMMTRFCDASALSLNHGGLRPIEPFLTDPDDLIHDCPAEMTTLLRKLLALRACK